MTITVPACLIKLFPRMRGHGVQCFRRLEAQDHLRRKQAEMAAERRAELAAEKAALLQARIDRGWRVRRAQQLRNQRLITQKADEREAAAEAARRYVVVCSIRRS